MFGWLKRKVEKAAKPARTAYFRKSFGMFGDHTYINRVTLEQCGFVLLCHDKPFLLLPGGKVMHEPEWSWAPVSGWYDAELAAMGFTAPAAEGK